MDLSQWLRYFGNVAIQINLDSDLHLSRKKDLFLYCDKSMQSNDYEVTVYMKGHVFLYS